MAPVAASFLVAADFNARVRYTHRLLSSSFVTYGFRVSCKGCRIFYKELQELQLRWPPKLQSLSIPSKKKGITAQREEILPEILWPNIIIH